MQTTAKQIINKATDDETTVSNSGFKSHNPGLRALLAIKNFTATLEKDYAGLLQMESELDTLNKSGLLMIAATASPEDLTGWKESVLEMNHAVTGINDALTEARKKIAQKEKDGYPALWQQLAVHSAVLKDKAENTAGTGLDLLPEAVHQQWQKEYVQPGTALTQSMVTHVESCRVLLQMIERYTPEELNAITLIIAEKVPLDFTYEEAVEYQNDYYKALVNFRKEFKEKKNLWDKFLDILAGGTHQTPSERVMMERWLDGEKGELE